MPYCPRCDMEFVEGVTVCSDCGGPLLASEEEAKAMKAQMEKEMEERRKEAAVSVLGDRSPEELAEAAAKAQAQARAASPGVYVNRRQKYDDLKSSLPPSIWWEARWPWCPSFYGPGSFTFPWRPPGAFSPRAS